MPTGLVLLVVLTCAWLEWWTVFGFLSGIFLTYVACKRERKREALGDAASALTKAKKEGLESALGVLPAFLVFPDYERVQWINQMLEKLWPFVARAASETLPGVLQPLLDEYCPSGLGHVQIREIRPGTKPPILGGIKVSVTTDDEVILDMDFKWSGNQQVLLDARKVRSRIHLSVSLERVLAFGHIRIILRPLIPQWPLFARLHLSLLSEPYIDFTIKALGGTLGAIPGLEESLKRLTRRVLGEVMVWPKNLVIPIKKGDFNTSPRYKGELFLRLVRGIHLKHVAEERIFQRPFNSMDPFVTAQVRDLHIARTTVQNANRNPTFNMESMFLVEDPLEQKLKLNVYDYNLFTDNELIGSVVLPIRNLEPNVPSNYQHSILGERKGIKYQCGEVQYQVLYMPYLEKTHFTFPRGWEGFSQKSVIFVMVSRARKLGRRGFAPTNARVCITYGGEQKATKVCPATQHPVWDETLEFVGVDTQLYEFIKVEVFNTRRWGGRGALLGWVEVPLSSIHASGGRLTDCFMLNGTSKGTVVLTFSIAGAV